MGGWTRFVLRVLKNWLVESEAFSQQHYEEGAIFYFGSSPLQMNSIPDSCVELGFGTFFLLAFSSFLP